MTISRLLNVFPLLGACLLPVCASAAMKEAPPSQAKPPLHVAICDDENEWPPYSYYQRIDGKKTSKLTGYAVDVIGEIFARHGVSFKIDLIPWPRCVAVVNMGKQYGMVLNLSHNTEREKTFLFSRPYYSTTPYYYYSKKNNPQGLHISSAADIHKYRVCGVQGYNYESYGMKPGEVDQGAKNFPALITKVQLGRCALFIEKDEVMVGFAAIGKHYLADPDIGKAPIPNMKPNLFYYGVSKNLERAEELRDLIDESLLHMEGNGRLAELWRKAAAAAKP